MSNQERVYIRPIQRKTKQVNEENKKEIIVNDDYYGLSYYENDSEGFQNLSEDFFGKCILMDCKEDNEILKKNKVGENQCFQLNHFIQKTICSIEIKNSPKQQSLEKKENFESLETLSNLSYGEDFVQDDFLVVQLSEINYLDELNDIQKQSVVLKKKNNYCSKQKFNNKLKEHLLPKIQKKNILKQNKKA